MFILLDYYQKVVDSFAKRCIISAVEDGADSPTSARVARPGHPRPELR